MRMISTIQGSAFRNPFTGIFYPPTAVVIVSGMNDGVCQLINYSAHFTAITSKRFDLACCTVYRGTRSKLPEKCMQ